MENPVFNSEMWKTAWRRLREWILMNKEGMKMGYSLRTFCCPYYEKDGKRSVHCEGGRIALPNRELTQDYFDAYCGDVTGWKRCTVARAITRFYEDDGEE